MILCFLSFPLPFAPAQVYLLLFGDFKQLPPATSRPPFIVLPSVRTLFRFALGLLQMEEKALLGLQDMEDLSVRLRHLSAAFSDVALFFKKYAGAQRPRLPPGFGQEGKVPPP